MFIKDTYGDHGIKIKFLANNKDEFKSITGHDSEKESIDDFLLKGEPDIYHVVLEYKKKLYDEMGAINIQYLLDLASDQYDDENPFLYDVDGNEEAIIRQNTDWNIGWPTFYRLFKKPKGAVLKEMPTLSHDDGDSPSEKDIENRFNSIANRKEPFDVQDNGKYSFVSYNTQMGQKAMFIVDNETKKPVGKITYQQELAEIPKILNSGVVDAYRGQGLGQQGYELLLKRYGSLSSDKTLSPHSFKLWKRLGDKYEGKTYLAQVANNWGDTNPKITYRLVDDFSLSMLTNPRERFVIKL
jgi:hypothetical protein